MTAPDHNPLHADDLPTVTASEALIARDAAAARRELVRRGAGDCAGALGLGGAR